MVNNIRNNTISEIDAKKDLNTLNEIKNAEIIKHKRYIPKQKELLNLFDNLLDAILTDKTLKSKNQKDNTLMSSKDDNDNENDTENDNIIKQLNDCLDEIIDKSKSFEDQIEPIRKKEHIKEYYLINDFGYKELKFKIFEVRIAHLSNEINEDLFEQLFDYKFETLANKLINTTNKE